MADNMPTTNQLPVVQLGGVDYFVDKRLIELRRTDNPSERLTPAEAVARYIAYHGTADLEEMTEVFGTSITDMGVYDCLDHGVIYESVRGKFAPNMAHENFHRTFEIDERVVVDPVVAGIGVTGTIAGVVAEHLIDNYIVLLDAPRTFNHVGQEEGKWLKPWRAIAVQGTLLKRIG